MSIAYRGTGAFASANSLARPMGIGTVSMQALSQDQIAMAKTLGYVGDLTNMSSGQLDRVNAALADAAARTQAQQASTSGGATTVVVGPLPLVSSAGSANALAIAAGNKSAAGSTANDTVAAAFNLSDFINQNSTMLLIAAAAVVGFMMFSGGGEGHRGRY